MLSTVNMEAGDAAAGRAWPAGFPEVVNGTAAMITTVRIRRIGTWEGQRAKGKSLVLTLAILTLMAVPGAVSAPGVRFAHRQESDFYGAEADGPSMDDRESSILL